MLRAIRSSGETLGIANVLRRRDRMAPRKLIPDIVRVERRCVYEDRGYLTPCFIWNGGVDRYGYGKTHVGSAADGTRKGALVHRVVFQHHKGLIPEGLVLDHLCRQPDCCNPDHLEAVTQAVNVQRGLGGEVARERHAAATHCKNGHPWTPENTRPRVESGYQARACRACNREAQARYASRRYA